MKKDKFGIIGKTEDGTSCPDKCAYIPRKVCVHCGDNLNFDEYYIKKPNQILKNRIVKTALTIVVIIVFGYTFHKFILDFL